MWKGPFVDAFLLKLKNKGAPLNNRKIWSRRSVILAEFLNSTVRIYNGNSFVRCKITEAKVGHKFGEFALTRRRKFRGSDGKGGKTKTLKKGASKWEERGDMGVRLEYCKRRSVDEFLQQFKRCMIL
ncbi:unnamed protein product [Linum tenue]|uniref:Ribosomal protein S19 n=1 Tax=Linum tenue TaxID=586396 RepID=A0AAV0MIJ2_9ROSI|nr:unnamed protein product [Linum tenue]